MKTTTRRTTLILRGCESAVTTGNGSGDACGAERVVLVEGDVGVPTAPGVMVPLDRPHRVRDRGRAMTARLVAAALAVVLVLVVDGTASAHWGVSGAGANSGTTGASAPVVLGSTTPAAHLRPGGTADVVLVVTNPNPFTVHFGLLALDTGRGAGGFAVDAGHSGCPTSVLSFTARAADWTAPARVGDQDGVLPITLPDALAMASTAANSCQGASFTVHLVVGS